MDVYEAVTSRRAVRAFTDEPVPKETIERVLEAAARAPSGSNLQPWRVYVVRGAELAELKRRTAKRVAAGDCGDPREFEMLPARLAAPYAERRAGAMRQRCAALGIDREDAEARAKHLATNWQCFGAPCLLLCFVDRDFGAPQWADLGMYLQTVMLLCRAEGLHTCPQLSWTVYRETVAEVVSPPKELVLFCGMSIGFEDRAVPHVRIERAPQIENVTFLD